MAFAIAVTVCLVSVSAAAHVIGISTGAYTSRGAILHMSVSLARAEAATLVPILDADGDGHITAREVAGARSVLQTRIIERIRVSRGGAPCFSALEDASLTDQDGITLEAHADCPAAGPSFDLDVALLDDLPSGHRHITRTVSGANTHDEVLDRDHRTLHVPTASAANAEPTTMPHEATSVRQESPAWSFFKMGVSHILSGYDHLLFLLGIFLLRARLKQLLGIVTAFTCAHSVTLALATLGIVTPSPRIIEPAIALSIIYVGVENFYVKDATKRWRLTLAFGLVHGFGFASALREVGLPKAELPLALVTFNLGVEAGQLFVMALVLPILVLVRSRQAWFQAHGVRVLSGIVVLAGCVYFVRALTS